MFELAPPTAWLRAEEARLRAEEEARRRALEEEERRRREAEEAARWGHWGGGPNFLLCSPPAACVEKRLNSTRVRVPEGRAWGGLEAKRGRKLSTVPPVPAARKAERDAAEEARRKAEALAEQARRRAEAEAKEEAKRRRREEAERRRLEEEERLRAEAEDAKRRAAEEEAER